ncbi:hypothetical protein SAMN02745945_00122 [Peptoclostridium litorale DSM 5388]|uniref:Uncharacterized protein n=1 Tax=Peptoclostridium litorale DSM 5388 TaxID=1121324 RepID=A0A069RIN9_PEPLI|nr:hypothetical protein [Peptoclostridium litorale]KDR96628.1 hypothetical protein CLIT_2c02340 [Peptoclostridium litorale DSM 5388]SIN68298.1 hypothetical protein SAMN02745945_00122 [Peptoclostridium litorale DSM 5388]
MNTKCDSIMDKCIKIANEKYDGHFTLMKFSSNWRFCFDTFLPDNYTQGHLIINEMAEGETMEEAIRKGIDEDVNYRKIKLKVESFSEQD